LTTSSLLLPLSKLIGCTQLAVGEERPVFRSEKLIAACLLLLMPASLSAQDTAAAVIFPAGTVYLNGAQLNNSSAFMAGDVLQTRDNGAANINVAGSSAVVDSNSIVRFRADGFSLDRGSISVATGKGLSVYARDFKITPASGEWTQFYITRSSGSIGIIARKASVIVTCGSNTSTVKEGQQISREDAASCGLITKGNGAPAAVKGPIITSGRIEMGTAALGGGLALWILAGHDDDPVSPKGP
jgi:hypothetical protein